MRKVVGAALGIVLLAACSSNGSPSASSPSSSAAASGATVMVEGHSHMISGGVECKTTPAQTNATPAESGTQTTRITAKDSLASVSLSVSDLTPPDVNGFAISLISEGTRYQMPYQPVESATQVEASRQGKKYTVTGTGQAETTGQNTMRQLPFGIHITCP